MSYGRLAVSDRKRRIEFKDFVKEVTGEDGLKIHERIMDWRHGHVAHRTGAEFESAETVLAFLNGTDVPTEIHLVLEIDLGPLDHGEFATAFRDHVDVLSAAVYERKIRVFARKIIDDLNAGRITQPPLLHTPAAESTWERYILDQCVAKIRFNSG